MYRIASEWTPPAVKKLVKKVIGKAWQGPMPPYRHESVQTYSQYQEDLVVDDLLGRKDTGFYVDIGANNPVELSNTKRFYDRGWRGINVEPITTNFRLFEQARPRDCNLNVGVGSIAGEMVFYECAKKGGVYSGFDKSNVLRYARNDEIVTKTLPVLTLSSILADHLEAGTHIDYMSVDVEGLEIQVLEGNDWTRFRPHLILIEFGDKGIQIVRFLETNGYKYIFGNSANGIFIDDRRST